MEYFLEFYHGYGLEILGGIGIFLTGMAVLGLIRVREIEKRVEMICDSVQQYLTCVMEEENDAAENENIKILQKTTDFAEKKRRREEEQNRIITSVLEELFP